MRQDKSNLQARDEKDKKLSNDINCSLLPYCKYRPTIRDTKWSSSSWPGDEGLIDL